MENQKLLVSFIIGLFLLCGATISFSQTNFWQQTKGPEGGFIRALVIDSEGRIFAGTYGSGIFRSNDNGETWTEVNNGLLSGRNSSIFSFSINSSDHIFAGSWSNPWSGGGVYRSVDHGETWTLVGKSDTGLTNTYVLCLAINPSGYIFAGTEWGGIFRSSDNGETWTEINTGLTKMFVTSLAVNQINGYIFAGTGNLYQGLNSGIFRSTDSGISWTEVYAGEIPAWVYGLSVNSRGYIFAGIFRVGVFCSKDGGTTWHLVNSALHTEIYCLAINSIDNIFVGTGGGGVFLSANDGSSWTPLNTGLTGTCVMSLAINSNEDIFAGTWYGGGIFRLLHNSESWTQINTGLRNTWITSIAINSSDHIFVGTWSFWGGSGGAFRSTNNGESWTQINNGLIYPFVNAFAINPKNGYIFAGTPYGAFRSTDDGESWTQIGLTDVYYSSLVISSSGDIFAGTSLGVLRSTDNGTNWIQTSLTNPEVRSLVINPKNGYIFAGTSRDGVFRSIDNGTSWIQTSLIWFDVTYLAINPKNGYIFAAAWGGGVFRSENDGQNWILCTSSPRYAKCIAINSEGHIFTGYSNYRSADNGESWIPIYDGLANFDVGCFAFNSDGYIFAGTCGGGVFRSVETTLTTKTIAIDIKPGDFPNAINPKSQGQIPVAILTTADFDAAKVDSSTVRFGITGTEASPTHSVLEDVDQDGDLDLILHFKIQETGIQCGDASAYLTGKNTGGQKIKGSDSIETVGCI